MTLFHICDACQGELHVGKDLCECEVTQVVIDSRKIKQGGLFLATKGERVDGHDFIPEVYQKGALAVVCEKAPEDKNIPYILVEDSLVALKQIAEYYRKQLDVKVVGITGSVGKTSTKEFIASVLEQKYRVCKTVGNFNNEVGLPLTVLSIKDSDEIAVLEMGISDFGEMTRLSRIARPDVCVLTNIGQCHLENLHTREGILKAKTEIFEYMKEDGSVVINGDDDLLSTLKQVHGKKPITFGCSETNDVVAISVNSLGLFGTNSEIKTNSDRFEVSVPLPGEHMVMNAACATAVGEFFLLSIEQIKQGIESVQSVAGRSNIIKLNNFVLIDDCYNANPVSMKAAIDLLKLSNTRKVAILGDMFELGTNEAKLHYEIGEYAAHHNLDSIICVGKLSRNTYEGVVKSKVDNVFYYETKQELISKLFGLLKAKDTILMKASHGMGFQEIVHVLQENDASNITWE